MTTYSFIFCGESVMLSLFLLNTIGRINVKTYTIIVLFSPYSYNFLKKKLWFIDKIN